MRLDDDRSQARRELADAVEAANARHRENIEHIIATSEGSYGDALEGADRALRRERSQAWREYRRRIAEIRKGTRHADV